jgi:hypothetical protein
MRLRARSIYKDALNGVTDLSVAGLKPLSPIRRGALRSNNGVLLCVTDSLGLSQAFIVFVHR